MNRQEADAKVSLERATLALTSFEAEAKDRVAAIRAEIKRVEDTLAEVKSQAAARLRMVS